VAAVSTGDCPAIVAAIMIQFNRVAAAVKTPEDNVNCLADAYEQPGFCALTQTVCCPSCTFAPVARPTTSHQHVQLSLPLRPCTHLRSNATHEIVQTPCTGIVAPALTRHSLLPPGGEKFATLCTDRWQIVALFTGNACGAASGAISAQFTVDVVASFGAEGGMDVIKRAAAPC